MGRGGAVKAPLTTPAQPSVTRPCRIAGFAASVGVLGGAAWLRTGKPTGLLPLLPLSFVTAYNYDLCYGTKLQRVREEAGRIIQVGATPSRHGAAPQQEGQQGRRPRSPLAPWGL